MPKKSTAPKFPEDFPEMFQHLLKHLDNRFDQVDKGFVRIDERFDEVDRRFAEMFKELGEIKFLVSAQERRISILEDRMRMVATKIGLEFRQQA